MAIDRSDVKDLVQALPVRLSSIQVPAGEGLFGRITKEPRTVVKAECSIFFDGKERIETVMDDAQAGLEVFGTIEEEGLEWCGEEFAHPLGEWTYLVLQARLGLGQTLCSILDPYACEING